MSTQLNELSKSEKVESIEPDSKPVESMQTLRDVDLDEKAGDHVVFLQNTKPFVKPGEKEPCTITRVLITIVIVVCLHLLFFIIRIGMKGIVVP
jgi:hypothetical protein